LANQESAAGGQHFQLFLVRRRRFALRCDDHRGNAWAMHLCVQFVGFTAAQSPLAAAAMTAD